MTHLTPEQIRQLQTSRRQSARLAPIYAMLLAVVCLLLFGANRAMDIPPLVNVIIIGAIAFTLALDLFNILYASRKLKRAERELEKKLR